MAVQPQRLIESCYEAQELQTATPGRRLGAYVLDNLIAWALAFAGLLAGAVFPLFLLLVLGWFVWFAVVAQYGQTPGKQLLGVYILREDGSRAGGWYTVLRVLVIHGFLFAVAGSAISFGVVWIVGGLWCTWDRERQCLWDKVASTYVAYSPQGFRPLTANEMRILGQQPPAAGGIATERLVYSAPARPFGQRESESRDTAPGEHPAGERLRELQRLHSEDLITDEQYEEQRARIVEEL